MGQVRVTIEVTVNEITYQYDKELPFTERGYSSESDLKKAETLLAEGHSKIQRSLESQQ